MVHVNPELHPISAKLLGMFFFKTHHKLVILSGAPQGAESKDLGDAYLPMLPEAFHHRARAQDDGFVVSAALRGFIWFTREGILPCVQSIHVRALCA